MTPSTPHRSELSGLGIFQDMNRMRPDEAVAFARRIEQWGYRTLWVPEGFGHESFTTLAFLAAHTERVRLATGITNIWLRSAGIVAQAARTLRDQTGGRFMLGLGVGHRGTIVDLRHLAYGKPLERMRHFLTEMDESPWYGPQSAAMPPRVLAALGPRMLELAATAADGAFPNWTVPEHTARARQVLGPDKLLCVEQNVIVTTDAAAARARIGRAMSVYRDPTHYRNHWLRLGFSATDIDDRSDRFVDGLVPWGPASSVLERVREHYDAGADHVCLQVLSTEGDVIDWSALAELAPASAEPGNGGSPADP